VTAVDILESMTDAFSAWDRNFRYIYVNARAAQLLGMSRDQLIGQCVWDLFPETVGTEVYGKCQQAMVERVSVSFDAFFPTSDTWNENYVHPTMDGLSIYWRDITERKRAEALLREAHERIELVLESITDKFFAIDGQWRYTYFNGHAKEQLTDLGKDPEALLGKVLWEEFPNPSSEAALRRAMRDRVETADEQYSPAIQQWYENRIYPSPDGGLAIFQTCVTANKLVEEKLRRSEADLAEGQRLTHTGSWAWNVLTGELFWSAEHFRICGLDPEKERPSYPSMQWIHPDDRVRVQETFERAIREGTDFELDCRVVWADRTIRYVHSFAHPVFNERGDLTEYVGTILDTTGRKQEEEARSKLVRRLFAAQEDERGRISRELHDDFGQQVSALALTLAAIQRDHSENADLATQLLSLEAIVNQLGSDINLIAWQLRPAALDDFGLAAALRSYVERWSVHVDVRAELHVDGIAANLLTHEHETALYRIAQEALNNVARHARARRVVILLQRRSEHVCLVVEDDGVGFDTDRLLAARDKRLGVVGMRERASLLGGTLDVESKRGHGTTVVARIPALVLPGLTSPNNSLPE
jgi:PAS domain S-box-containing protein